MIPCDDPCDGRRGSAGDEADEADVCSEGEACYLPGKTKGVADDSLSAKERMTYFRDAKKARPKTCQGRKTGGGGGGGLLFGPAPMAGLITPNNRYTIRHHVPLIGFGESPYSVAPA